MEIIEICLLLIAYCPLPLAPCQFDFFVYWLGNTNWPTMKNILIFFMIAGGLTSCSKHSFDIYNDVPSGPEQSEIMVRVSYLSWSGDQCEPGCGGTSYEDASVVANASVYLFTGGNALNDVQTTLALTASTNEKGEVLLADLPPDTYTVTVTTAVGTKTRILTTQMHKRTYIDFSY